MDVSRAPIPTSLLDTPRRRRRFALLLAALLALAALAAHGAWRLAERRAINARIAQGVPELPNAQQAEPVLRFAHAHALAARETAAAREEALRLYGTLNDDPQLGPAARFNSANLLQRQGTALVASSGQPGQAVSLLELAKQGYRALLRQQPGHAGARYNMDRAQRLQPEPEPQDDEPAGARQAAERAATTMRGYTPGLP